MVFFTHVVAGDLLFVYTLRYVPYVYLPHDPGIR